MLKFNDQTCQKGHSVLSWIGHNVDINNLEPFYYQFKWLLSANSAASSTCHCLCVIFAYVSLLIHFVDLDDMWDLAYAH